MSSSPTLGAQSLHPPLIYGTAWKKADTAALVTQAIQLGFRAIDTACQPKHYNEAGVGAGIAAATRWGLKRADLYIQTKFTPLSSQDPQALPYDREAGVAEQVAQSLAASLRNLKTDYLDALVLHSPLADERQTLQAWRAMEAAVEAGSVRRLGISNCYKFDQFVALYNAAGVKPTVLQNRFYDKTGYDRELRAFCLDHGITYQSFWTLTANAHLLEHAVVIIMAARLQRRPEQILFRYLTQVGVLPLTGTTSAQHMREDLAIVDFTLSAQDLEAIGKLL